jgi:hypothetical protein
VLLCIFIIFNIFTSGELRFFIWFATGSSLYVFGVFTFAELRERRGQPRTALGPRTIAIYPLGIVLVGMTLALIMSASYNLGADAAFRVKAGEEAVGGWSDFFHIEAQPVRLFWTGAKVPDGLSTPSKVDPANNESMVVFLGDNDGVTIVYDRASCAVIRIPSGSIVVASAIKSPTKTFCS